MFVTGFLKSRVQIVEIIHGSAVTIQALHSDVIVHVPDGVYGIILGNIHTDPWRFRYFVSEKDCIIAPICEFFFKSSSDCGLPSGARFHFQAPHVVEHVAHLTQTLKVSYRHSRNQNFQEIKHITHAHVGHSSPTCYFESRVVHIFTRHFTEFLITSEGINHCSGSAEMMIFSKMNTKSQKPIADISIHMGSLLYQMEDFAIVSNFNPINVTLTRYVSNP